MNLPFSRKKAKLDALMSIERSIAIELKSFTSHLQTVQMAYTNIQKQNVEIIMLLKELTNGQ